MEGMEINKDGAMTSFLFSWGCAKMLEFDGVHYGKVDIRLTESRAYATIEVGMFWYHFSARLPYKNTYVYIGFPVKYKYQLKKILRYLDDRGWYNNLWSIVLLMMSEMSARTLIKHRYVDIIPSLMPEVPDAPIWDNIRSYVNDIFIQKTGKKEFLEVLNELFNSAWRASIRSSTRYGIVEASKVLIDVVPNEVKQPLRKIINYFVISEQL